MKIGEAIKAFDRSSEEEDRILKSVIHGVGKAAEVYSVYSPGCDDDLIWKKAQKILNITGFRPGKARGIILSRVDKGIKSNNPKSTLIFWMIYFNCVVTYLRKEHPNLNQLLLERDLESDPDSTVGLIEAIKNLAALYEVTDSQIEDFYECYWFDRVDDFKSVVKKSNIDVGFVQELISISEKKQAEAISSLEKKVKAVGLSDKAQASITSLQKNISEITSKVEHLKEDFELESAKFEKSFVELVDVRFSNLEKKQINSLGEEKKKQIEDKIAANQVNIDNLNKKIETLTAEKEKKRLVRKKLFVNDISSFSKNVKHIINNDKFNVFHSEVLKDTIILNGAFYIDSEKMFSSICSHLIREGRVKEIVITPSKLEFTNEEFEQFLDYEAIYLKNISAGFIEGTVIPLIIKSNSIVDANFPKVFVEYDGDINSSMEALIRKSSLDLSIETIIALTAIDSDKEGSRNEQSENFEISSYYSDVQKILNNTGVYLDREVYERLVNLGHIFVKHMNENSALPLALKIVVIPYVDSVYGKTKSQVALELINGTFSE